MTATYFHDTYLASREQFRALALAQGGTLTTQAITACGPDGDALTVDIAYFGAEQPARVLLVFSGTHGIEGFAGSACQQQFLAEDFAALPLPADGALLMVHAVNPYGFAWLRRANEHNVDLNRNFLDHSTNTVRRPEYVALNDVLNPTECTEATDAAFTEAAVAMLKEHGMAHLQAVLSNGQYECPEGVYYGGNALEESNAILRRLFQDHVRQAQQAFMIDFHTGLGDPGEYTILTEHLKDTQSYAFLEQAFREGCVETTVGGESISAELCGQIGEALERHIPGVWFVNCACEFGTVPGPQVMQALRHENWLHHHGERDSAQGQTILADIRDAFCPDSEEWRTRVLTGGRECLTDAWRAFFSD